MLGLIGATAVNRVEMGLRFVPAVALIQCQVEEDVLAKGSYSKLRIAFILSVQASAEHFHKIMQKIHQLIYTSHSYISRRTKPFFNVVLLVLSSMSL